MISYEPKEWFTFIFRFPKADTFRKLIPMLLTLMIYAALIAYLEVSVMKLTDTSRVKNITLMHGLLGFVISLLLVFRTNTAYDRWWEGRRLWGTLVNNSRSLSMKMAALLRDEEDRDFYAQTIPSFADTLREHLRKEETRLELFDIGLKKQIDPSKHIPNQVAKLMYQKTIELHRHGKLSSEDLLFINPELISFTEVCGACERIRNTPIPYSYSSFIKKFIFFYVMTLPMGYVFNLGYLVVPMTAFIFYVLASLEMIAEEIEEPFGHDSNDLPLTRLCQSIRKQVGEILE